MEKDDRDTSGKEGGKKPGRSAEYSEQLTSELRALESMLPPESRENMSEQKKPPSKKGIEKDQED